MVVGDANVGPIVDSLSADVALRMLEEGRPPATAVAERSHPFYNPYLLVKTGERLDNQKRFYRRLLERCELYIVNIGAGAPDKIQQAIRDAVSGQGKAVLR